MRFKGLGNIEKLYFIGIGGVSMSALAKLLSVYRYSVSGSDAVRGEEMENLAFYGIKTFIGSDENRKELLDADAVIYTDAIPATDPEKLRAESCGKRILSRAELLKIVSDGFSKVVAIAGSHGKTTCTSICAHTLKALSVPFTAHIGGQDSLLGNFYTNGTEFFVTEACEYKKNFLKLSPDVAVLLNVDKDHMECYEDENDLISSFRQYCNQAKTAFVCADDPVMQMLGDHATFGINNSLSDYRAVDLRAIGERYAFTVEEYGKPVCRIRMQAIGKCNVYNALAAFAAMRSFGFNEKDILTGIQSFKAVKRRFEKIGTYHGAAFICDYAHHPREIASTLATANGISRGNLYVVFQPHTYSRTKLLMQEFIQVLRPIKNLMIYKTFPAREKYDEEGSAMRLAQMVGNCLYSENVFVLRTWLKTTLKENDTVLFLGAGDIYYAAQYLLKELN